MVKSNGCLISILLIMASLSSPSHGLISLPGINITRVIIEGVVYCSPVGDPRAPAISNATVYMTCAGLTTSLPEAVTNPTGAFTMVLINILKNALFDPSFCCLGVNVPVGNCNLVVPDGVLTATVKLVNVTVTNINTAVFSASPFTSRR